MEPRRVTLSASNPLCRAGAVVEVDLPADLTIIGTCCPDYQLMGQRTTGLLREPFLCLGV